MSRKMMTFPTGDIHISPLSRYAQQNSLTIAAPKKAEISPDQYRKEVYPLARTLIISDDHSNLIKLFRGDKIQGFKMTADYWGIAYRELLGAALLESPVNSSQHLILAARAQSLHQGQCPIVEISRMIIELKNGILMPPAL